MLKMIENLKPGADVWVVERDETDEAVDTTGYVFIAQSGNYVICSPSINGIDNIDYILSYHAQETAESYNTNLYVFPVTDCYATLTAAKKAYNDETGGSEEDE